jgi:hypothetical protein
MRYAIFSRDDSSQRRAGVEPEARRSERCYSPTLLLKLLPNRLRVLLPVAHRQLACPVPCTHCAAAAAAAAAAATAQQAAGTTTSGLTRAPVGMWERCQTSTRTSGAAAAAATK